MLAWSPSNAELFGLGEDHRETKIEEVVVVVQGCADAV
jgi:hypothetical protein